MSAREPIYVSNSATHGRGVFAGRSFEPGDLIERAPVLVMPPDQAVHVDQTALYDYYFAWGEDGLQLAIALGFGSLYNHSYVPNARYEKNLAGLTIDVIACRAIAPGDEITLNYNGDEDDASELWFPVTPGTR